MSRFSIVLTVLGFLLIALGLWVALRFVRVSVPDPSNPTATIEIPQAHPAAHAGGSIVIAGAVCLAGAAINNQNRRAAG